MYACVMMWVCGWVCTHESGTASMGKSFSPIFWTPTPLSTPYFYSQFIFWHLAALSVYSTDQLFSSPKALILPLGTMFTCSGSSAQDTAEMGGGWVRSWWKPIDPAPCIPRTGRKLLVQLNKTLPTGSKQVTRVLMFLQELPTGNICDFWYMSFYTN